MLIAVELNKVDFLNNLKWFPPFKHICCFPENKDNGYESKLLFEWIGAPPTINCILEIPAQTTHTSPGVWQTGQSYLYKLISRLK